MSRLEARVFEMQAVIPLYSMEWQLNLLGWREDFQMSAAGHQRLPAQLCSRMHHELHDKLVINGEVLF